MREMGIVDLLTREGEIKIAKRIEEGTKEVLSSISRQSSVIAHILDVYENMDEYDYNLSDIVKGFAASYEEQAQSIKDSFGSLLDQEDSDRLESNLTVADEVEVEEEGEEEGEGDRDASAVLGDDDVDHAADAGSDTQSSEGRQLLKIQALIQSCVKCF